MLESAYTRDNDLIMNDCIPKPSVLQNIDWEIEFWRHMFRNRNSPVSTVIVQIKMNLFTLKL